VTYKIVHKARLEDALKHLYESESVFDAVLLDLSLPDEEGLACL
jgi:DNA-binding response OmpR family regulator